MKNKIRLFLVGFIGVSLAFFSCGADENCRRDKYIVLSVDFRKAVIDTLGKQTLSAFAVNNTTVSGLDNDSILYNNNNISAIKLSLNKFADESRYEIVFNDTIDTLVIRHKNIEEYQSFECGCIVTHLIDTVWITEHFIDSVSIKNKEVNTLNATNIELYRHYDYRTDNQ